MGASLTRLPPAGPEEPEGSARVVRTGEAVLYRRITDEFLQQSARGPENLRVLRELGMASAMVVPMQARGRTLGALMLVSSDPDKLYDDDALAFVEHLGRRAAIAVDNALIYGHSEQRAHAARALAFVADGVVLVDEDGIVRIWNAAAEVITGLRERAIVGRPVAEAVPGWAAIEAHVPVAAGPGTPRAETVPLELEHGERWLSISGVALPGGTVYAFRDLTEERRVERLKSEFVSTISHELRTPLAAIYGAALTLQRRDAALESQRERLLDVVAAEAERLARIVNDILWVSRVESGTLHVEVESCDASELATAVVEAGRAHLPENLVLALDADADVAPVAADADKLRQILTNLRRQLRQVLARRRHGPDPRRERRRVRPLRGRRRGPGHPRRGAPPDLREVLPPRSRADARRGRHRPRPLHLARARPPDERPDPRGLHRGRGLRLHGRAADRPLKEKGGTRPPFEDALPSPV